MEKNNLNSERKSLIEAVKNMDITFRGVHKNRIAFISKFTICDNENILAIITIPKQKGDICDILQKGKKMAGR